MNVSISIGSFHGRVFKYSLHIFKGGAVNDWFMHIFGYVTLASVYILISFVSKMLRCLAVDDIAAILLPGENVVEGGIGPAIAVIVV